MAKHIIQFNVNGATREAAVEDHHTLASVLRNQFNLVGTKVGCDMGTCGCCTVLIEGRPVLSCLALAREYEGAAITTVEGLRDDSMHPLQRAWAECGGSQCGYCTPGFIMTATHLLEHNPDPTRDEIAAALSGNLCRCTGYVKIYDAVERAASEMRSALKA